MQCAQGQWTQRRNCLKSEPEFVSSSSSSNSGWDHKLATATEVFKFQQQGTRSYTGAGVFKFQPQGTRSCSSSSLQVPAQGTRSNRVRSPQVSATGDRSYSSRSLQVPVTWTSTYTEQESLGSISRGPKATSSEQCLTQRR
jgi:hypothetical protein